MLVSLVSRTVSAQPVGGEYDFRLCWSLESILGSNTIGVRALLCWGSSIEIVLSIPLRSRYLLHRTICSHCRPLPWWRLLLGLQSILQTSMPC